MFDMHNEISRIIEDRRAKALAYLAEFQIKQRTLPETFTRKIAAAEEFVRNSTVGSAALGIWRSTIHYHAWLKRPDWLKWNKIGVSDVMEQSDPSPCSTAFRWGDHAWVFTLERNGSSYSGDKALGKFQVVVDGELVMELAVANGFNEFEDWEETDVYALKVGPWVNTLVEMWAELELAEQRHHVEEETARLERQASRIKLG